MALAVRAAAAEAVEDWVVEAEAAVGLAAAAAARARAAVEATVAEAAAVVEAAVAASAMAVVAAAAQESPALAAVEEEATVAEAAAVAAAVAVEARAAEAAAVVAAVVEGRPAQQRPQARAAVAAATTTAAVAARAREAAVARARAAEEVAATVAKAAWSVASGSPGGIGDGGAGGGGDGAGSITLDSTGGDESSTKYLSSSRSSGVKHSWSLPTARTTSSPLGVGTCTSTRTSLPWASSETKVSASSPEPHLRRVASRVSLGRVGMAAGSEAAAAAASCNCRGSDAAPKCIEKETTSWDGGRLLSGIGLTAVDGLPMRRGDARIDFDLATKTEKKRTKVKKFAVAQAVAVCTQRKCANISTYSSYPGAEISSEECAMTHPPHPHHRAATNS